MTTNEMSDLFDLLSNANRANWGFGEADRVAFDEYEKSVYLTAAQEMFVVSCYNGKNNSGYQFEVTEEDRRLLDSLVASVHLEEMNTQCQCIQNIVPESKMYKLPCKLMFVTYEGVRFSDDSDNCIDGRYVTVCPVTQDEFWKTYKNPVRGANDRRVLRLDAGNNIVELVSKHPIDDYFVRFIKKPAPIILVDLPSESDISVFDGETNEQPCTLDSMLHYRIVELAVNIALQRKSIGNSK